MDRKIMPKTKSELVLEAVRGRLYDDEKSTIKENKYQEYNTKIEDMYEKDNQVVMEYLDFKKSVKEDLFAECMYKIYMPGLRNVESPRKYQIAKGLVKDYIQENGIDFLLRKCKYGSPLLYEMYELTNRYSDIILEEVDKNNPNTFNIDTELKDNFFDDIDASKDLNTSSSLLRERISTALDDFLMDNVETKGAIEEIIQQTQERIEANKNTDVRESYNELANRRIMELKERKPKGILESMIYNVSSSSIVNENMRSIYINENGKLDMDKIVDETCVMYGFLEMLNLCKFENVNEEYLLKNINNLK